MDCGLYSKCNGNSLKGAMFTEIVVRIQFNSTHVF